MKFTITHVDTPNGNDRIYPRSVMQKAIDEYTKNFISEKRAFLCNKQLETSTVCLTDVIGLINSIEIYNDGSVIADIKQINANNAYEIWPLIHRKELSVVLAGLGSLVNNKEGMSVVQDDFELLALFVTDDPA